MDKRVEERLAAIESKVDVAVDALEILVKMAEGIIEGERFEMKSDDVESWKQRCRARARQVRSRR